MTTKTHFPATALDLSALSPLTSKALSGMGYLAETLSMWMLKLAEPGLAVTPAEIVGSATA